jgi:hypothetical protein
MTLLEQFADRLNDEVVSEICDGVAEIVIDSGGLY